MICGMKTESLKDITRFGIGGKSEIVYAKNEKDLVGCAKKMSTEGRQFFVLGGGTNVIAHDGGYAGTVIAVRTNSIAQKRNRVRVDAGVLLEALINKANKEGLSGLEALAGIPGTVGGALYGNAGAYGHEIQEVVERVRVFDGVRIRALSRKECGFGYRESIFKKKKWIILSATLIFKKDSADDLKKISRRIRTIRNKKYPQQLRCAGSIFKNIIAKSKNGRIASRQIPKEKIAHGKIPAGVLLEAVGAKGMKRGKIQVADYHANLIINTGGGSANDVRYIINTLKKRVYRVYGVMLEEEIRYLGF
ncbi:MAG: UDP-N-acetylenolpyruvoylglucosamine reductase [Candidatus Niyogibacteria bacterium CG10_big_fil_rev_8_21_14_0_10_46_36]|uniref:UDP-N-acetylenolpyruvoylglucosamine reductase n=1 Tax=Candidatus Niyogibacteria bacterium CG10_big_fil_rev_8_21_14_0_10_46_36 TaxID=1974726 RepID=A0A2H0TDG3_9BACT|nr:MAG: UDP-N-acetylenolpyruvoylglucosamine reductase [Candidatus Niyogibacteria bacterium CG10_big_fil_rev_8_21_14_0_10_46_36]